MEKTYNILKFKLNDKYKAEHPNVTDEVLKAVFTKENFLYNTVLEGTKMTFTEKAVKALFDQHEIDIIEGDVN